MGTIHASLKRWGSYSIHITAISIYFLYFILVFDPLVSSGHFSEVYSGSLTLNIFMCSAIVLASVAVVRMIFTFLCKAKRVRMTWFAYILWCLMEIVVASQFLTLYTCLMVGMHYRAATFMCLRYSAAILMVPYVVVALAVSLHEVVEMKRKPAIEDEGLVRFHDENQKLKLVIAPSALLYFRSDENYVKIFYMEGGKLKSYVLRNSMKSVEQVTSLHGLRRCHRSYIINPSHVKVLKKEPDGSILAELDVDMVDAIPVSKRYYESLSDLL